MDLVLPTVVVEKSMRILSLEADWATPRAPKTASSTASVETTHTKTMSLIAVTSSENEAMMDAVAGSPVHLRFIKVMPNNMIAALHQTRRERLAHEAKPDETDVWFCHLIFTYWAAAAAAVCALSRDNAISQQILYALRMAPSSATPCPAIS